LENISAIFGLHIVPTYPIGEVASRSGPIFAGSGFFEATINGRGGHAAIPQHSIDPILAASNVIVSLQHIVSREADPLDSQVSLFHFNLSLPATDTHVFLVYMLTLLSKSIQVVLYFESMTTRVASLSCICSLILCVGIFLVFLAFFHSLFFVIYT